MATALQAARVARNRCPVRFRWSTPGWTWRHHGPGRPERAQTERSHPFDCARHFPVPPKRQPTPIEHIVLVVRENKTYDTLLGALEGADGDPSLVLFGEDITPNISALARRFTNHDNFYNDSETSVQGHLWLTSSFVNDYMERICSSIIAATARSRPTVRPSAVSLTSARSSRT
jgi:phospholipase C